MTVPEVPRVSIVEDPLVVEASHVPEVPSAMMKRGDTAEAEAKAKVEKAVKAKSPVSTGQPHREAHRTTLHEFVHQTLPGPNPEEPRIPPLPVQVYKGGGCQTPIYDVGLCRTQNSPSLAMSGRSDEFRCGSPWLPPNPGTPRVSSYRYVPPPLSSLSSPPSSFSDLAKDGI